MPANQAFDPISPDQQGKSEPKICLYCLLSQPKQNTVSKTTQKTIMQHYTKLIITAVLQQDGNYSPK